MSAPHHRRSLSVLLCFAFLFAIANCDSVPCFVNGCQSSRYWKPQYAGQTITYSTNLQGGYEMYLDVYFQPNEQSILIGVNSAIIAPVTVTVLWNGNSGNVAVPAATDFFLTTSLYMAQNGYNDRYLRFVIKNDNFFTSNVDLVLSVNSYRYSLIDEKTVTAIATYIIIIIAVVAAVIVILIITCICCCIRRKRRSAAFMRKQQAERSALPPISASSNSNNVAQQQLQNNSPYQQQPQQMMYMQNAQYPQQPQMMGYQQQPQGYPAYGQPQAQPQPQMQMMYQGSPQGY